MNKIKQSILAIVLLSTFAACNNAAKEEVAANDLKNYVDSVNNLTVEYTQAQWVLVNDGYQERATKVDLVREKLNEEEKAELLKTEKKYDELKARYEAGIKKSNENVAVNFKQRLRNSLFGEGKIGDDMSFSFVTAKNALETYTNFVENVSTNKDSYTREDWDEIKVLYEALDNRKNSIEKDLSGHDKRQIALKKVKFIGLKAGNRIDAKADENKKSKE